MIDARRRQTAALRRAVVRHLGAQHLLVTSTLVRAAVRVFLNGIHDITVMAWLNSAQAAIVFRYANTSRRSWIRSVQHARSPTQALTEPKFANGRQQDISLAVRRRVPSSTQATLLRDERVKRLQESIVAVVFKQLFAVDVPKSCLQSFANYSSVGWLSRQVLIAAGYRSAPPRSREASLRIASVIPTVARSLELQYKYLMVTRDVSERATEILSRERRRPERRKSQLYSPDIAIAYLTNKVTAVSRWGESKRLAIRTGEEIVRLEQRMELISAITQPVGNGFDGQRRARVLKWLGRLRQRP